MQVDRNSVEVSKVDIRMNRLPTRLCAGIYRESAVFTAEGERGYRSTQSNTIVEIRLMICWLLVSIA